MSGDARVAGAGDPHLAAGPAEAEVIRVRSLQGGWRWLLINGVAAISWWLGALSISASCKCTW